MYRFLESQLQSWKESANRKPLLLRGIRQVGKTWLMRDFGKRCFSHLAYLNCEKVPQARELFEGGFEAKRILSLLEILTETPILPGKTLLVLDEIQQVPKAVTALKYFCEDLPELHVMAAGSLLGVATLEGTGFPVGKVDFLDLYPMTFLEFLRALGKDSLAEKLSTGDWAELALLKDILADHLREYFYVGGMPEVVNDFAEKRDFRRVRRLQLALLKAYSNDFGKHAPHDQVARIRQVWNAIPGQLARENRKFLFGALRKGARSAEYELAIQWLCDAGLVSTVFCASKTDIPLSAYRENAFKLFSADLGLLAAQSDLDARSVISGNAIFEEFKGALTEQYVEQQLLAEAGLRPFYWSATNSQNEIDFIYQIGGQIYPHEVKAGENLQSKSLLFFARKNRIPLSIRSSMAGFRLDEIGTLQEEGAGSSRICKLLNLPLYAICRLRNEIQAAESES